MKVLVQEVSVMMGWWSQPNWESGTFASSQMRRGQQPTWIGKNNTWYKIQPTHWIAFSVPRSMFCNKCFSTMTTSTGRGRKVCTMYRGMCPSDRRVFTVRLTVQCSGGPLLVIWIFVNKLSPICPLITSLILHQILHALFLSYAIAFPATSQSYCRTSEY